MPNLLTLATDPEQYSAGKATTWMADDDRQLKQEQNFWGAIKAFIPNDCKSALDIGCGSGWSAQKFADLGVTNWVGLEPSSRHFEAAKKLHPEASILNETFERYDARVKFDCIIAIMVFSHISDVTKAFEKVSGLLNSGGVFIMMCSTFHDEKTRLERNGRRYEVEVIDEDQYVDKAIVGAYGIADINRKSEYYISHANSSGLTLSQRRKVEDVGYSPKELLVFVK